MLVVKSIYAVILQTAIFGLLLFVPATTLAWPRAWVFIAAIAAGTAVTVFYLRHDEGLINERLKGPLQRGQPLVDKIVLNLFLISFCGLFVFIALDGFHFHVLAPPGVLGS